jgi:hypothetical protein
MNLRRLEHTDYDRFLSFSAKAEHDAAVAANEAFIAAMTEASARGLERVKPGTFVDTSTMGPKG